MTTAKEIIAHMESLHNEEQRRVLMGFFKTGPGEYGEGDEFLGLKVPQTREVVNAVWKDLPLGEVPELLMNRWHEVRLCGLLVLVAKFEKLAGTLWICLYTRFWAIGCCYRASWKGRNHRKTQLREGLRTLTIKTIR